MARDSRERALDLVAEIRATPAAERRRRIEALAQPLLVRLLLATLNGWDAEALASRNELKVLRDRVERLERPEAW